MKSVTGKRTQHQQATETILAKMMISIVVVFIICNSFECLVFILASLDLIELGTVQAYLRPLADLLMVINSSVNVAIYCGFSAEFREKFVELYIRCQWRSTQGNLQVLTRPTIPATVPKKPLGRAEPIELNPLK